MTPVSNATVPLLPGLRQHPRTSKATLFLLQSQTDVFSDDIYLKPKDLSTSRTENIRQITEDYLRWEPMPGRSRIARQDRIGECIRNL